MDRILKKQENVEGQLVNLQKKVSKELPTITISSVTVHLDKVNSLWEKAENYNDLIAEACSTDEETEKQIENFDSLYSIYCALRSQLLNLQTTLAVPTSSSTSATGTTSSRRVKLPPIDLPTFDGTYEQWTSFQDLFTATIHNDSSLLDSEKLKYLKNAVKGPAGNLIRELQVTNANYAQAWKLLSDRFNNQREIVTSVLKRLFGQSFLPKESVQGLQLLLDTTNECLATLNALSRPTDKWDDLIVFLTVDKLDMETRRQWAMTLKGTSLPTYEELRIFIERHIRGLHASGLHQVKPQASRSSSRISVSANLGTADVNCGICKAVHPTHKCDKLLKAARSQRADLVRSSNLCFNCLRPGHRSFDCTSSLRCKQCKRQHHTLLHQDKKESNATAAQQQQSSGGADSALAKSVNTNLASADMEDKEVLLSTAVVTVLDKYGTHQLFRVLIDNGSQATIITEKAMNIIGLPRRHSNIVIKGITEDPAPSRGEVCLRLHSRLSGDYIDVTSQILTKLQKTQPSQPLQQHEWEHTVGLPLADPNFYIPDGVDMLLGQDYYGDIIREGIRRGDTGSPKAQSTIFGWILGGPTLRRGNNNQVNVNVIEACDTDKILQRFWEVEELSSDKPLTLEEEQCEKHFAATQSRDSDGKFLVELPVKDISQLGYSMQMAVRRWLAVERRLQAKPDVYAAYNKFMTEYLSLGHMELVPEEEIREKKGDTNYLPHHYVIKDGKIRVVFDGSAKTTSGSSLNDCLLVGATLQDDVHQLLLRFRKHLIAVKADVVKMFRQFNMKKHHADLQRIVWRESPNHPLRHYRLTTVTYGTAPAPFLATRCLQQAAKDCSDSHPEASITLLLDTFVDDIMTGRATLGEAKQLQHQLISLLGSYGMELSKWASNSKEFMESLPEDMRGSGVMNFNSDNPVKALGVQWNHVSDCFYFSVSQTEVLTNPTKRQLSSELGKIFDPLGLLSPFVVRAKMLLQEVWKLKTKWDEPVPSSLVQQWLELYNERTVIQTISIPRCVFTENVVSYELYAFSDSSERAYGCSVYLRSKLSSGDYVVRLVTSKAKVAPMKQESLPRLELLGALMCAKLVMKVKTAMQLECDVFCYTDSTIVLHWIRGHPSQWKCFVGNRVAKIQGLIAADRWSHVKSGDNPADALSRGLSAEELKSSDLWWQGPSWLKEEKFPTSSSVTPSPSSVDLEERRKAVVVNAVICDPDLSLINKYSDLSKLQRVTAFMLRFVNNCRRPVKERRLTEYLMVAEMKKALYVLTRQVQASYFASDIAGLESGKLPKKSKLLPLNPFIDDDGILRVGGRLQKADIPESHKFPALLPHHARLATLIIQHYHEMYMHGGYQLLWCNLQREFWICNARSTIRRIVRACVICTRHRAELAQQQMGNLPSSRVTFTRCFLNTGCDYAGPFSLRVITGRSTKIMKGYFAIFVCMATKAIHLEAVKDLTTDAFIAALTRFTSRRGVPASVYSDCGTNFQGADRVLQEFWDSKKHQKELATIASSRGIQWHFNPPSAPHQGGLWEAGVKSVKYHLRREIGSTVLTYDEFETVLCQVEACLNSRPLTQMSSDPNDMSVLTPAHFLVGEPLTAIPHPNLVDMNVNRLSRWQRTAWITQHFWNRWQQEYLSSLQQRRRWNKKEANLEVGDLVLIKDDNSAPLQWKMGRVKEVHPGEDDLVRVVTLKTMTGELKRPIHKLCPLLKNNENE